MSPPKSKAPPAQQAYLKRLEVERLRREVFEQVDPSASKQRLDALHAAERELAVLTKKRVQAEGSDAERGVLFETK